DLSSSSLADLIIAEDEGELPLHLLQRRQMRRVKEYREAMRASAAEESSKARWPPPPFDFEDPGAKYSAFIEDNEESRPPPLTPMVVKAKPTRRRSLDLHFNAATGLALGGVSTLSCCCEHFYHRMTVGSSAVCLLFVKIARFQSHVVPDPVHARGHLCCCPPVPGRQAGREGDRRDQRRVGC
ncbi:unnamed protein product, partial [Symbiodinium necroappetens]